MSGRGFKLPAEDLNSRSRILVSNQIFESGIGPRVSDLRPDIWNWDIIQDVLISHGSTVANVTCFSSFLHQIGLCYINVILQRSILSHVLSSTENFHTMPLKIPLTEFVFSKVSFFTKRSCLHVFSQESYDKKQQYYYIENKIFEYSHVFAFTILYFCKYTFI